MGLKPTITQMHNMNYLHTQDGVTAISPIRLELVKKLQRLVPEMGFTTTEATTENSSGILTELAANLNGRARDTQNEYRDVIETRNMARGEMGMFTEDEWETEESDTDSDDTPEVRLHRPLR